MRKNKHFFERNLMSELISWKNKKTKRPLIIFGARQVGKTFLLKEFGLHFRQIVYIDFFRNSQFASIFEKDLSPKRILQELELLLETSIDVEQDLVIFDEIQYCSRALHSLKYFADEFPSGNIASAGSLL
ncbi:MAG: AAA family ATPase [Oligoflexia bacterium]|nr:AAA family ATPase [Oligoflexia bacterium]